MSEPTYLRGLREPTLDFVGNPLPGNLGMWLQDMIGLRVITPVPKEVVQDLRLGFDLSRWPTFAARLDDRCRSFERSQVIPYGTHEPVPTDDPDEPSALWLYLVLPIPVALLEDRERTVDFAAELLPQIEEGVVLMLREHQTKRMMGNA